MNVKNIEIVTSPMASDRTCVRAEVAYNYRPASPEVYWIDVPDRYSGYLSASGNAWLALMLPLAVHLCEPLVISRPVDRELFNNVHELMRVWNCWYPQLKPIRVEAEVQDQEVCRTAGATAALLSGGVDAWFTLLSHTDDCRPDRIRIDDLLCIWGLDIPLDYADDFRKLRDALVQATSGLGMEFVEVATNLRETRWWEKADWGHVGNGSALASIAHALSGRYARLLVPSSYRYTDGIPWGSHPPTDPLLSSSLTKITHDGAAFTRVEKMEALIKSEAALNSLQVCWASARYENCGECSKCYRTMTTLFVLGALERCPRFDRSAFDKKKVAKIVARDPGNRAFLREIRQLAVREGKPEIGRAIDHSLRRSRRIDLYLRLTKRLMRNSPWLREHVEWRVERTLLRNSVR